MTEGWRKRQIQMQITMDDDGIQEYAHPCPSCEYNKQRAQLWRDEAYKHAGHPLPDREPVAWISAKELLVMRGNANAGAKDWRVNLGLEPEEGDVGLYTAPPHRSWSGLTRTELVKCGVLPFGLSYELYQAIETKLKEKNNG